MKKIKYQVKNFQGIHARPAILLVNEFNKYNCNVIVEKNGEIVNGKKIFALMSLSIKQEDTIAITFEGEEEMVAAKAAAEFLEENLS